MELLAMLLGLAVLIVGIVVFSAYQSAENSILLRSKYRTETASRFSGLPSVAGREIAGWQRRHVSLYRPGSEVTVPFTSGDRAVYTQENAIEGVNGELTSSARSAAEEYRYEALYPSRFNLREYGFEGLSILSTFDAARMISRSGSGHSDDAEDDAVYGDRLYNSGLLLDVFQKLIGRLPNPHDNASSEVYLPLRDETDEEE